jgi:hypothetical protein
VPVKFWYYFAPPGAPSAGRTMFGSWIWEQPGRQSGSYANLPLPRPQWFNGGHLNLPPTVPCRDDCLTCGLFEGWPRFTRAQWLWTDTFSSTTWSAETTNIEQVPNLLNAYSYESGKPGGGMRFDVVPCQAKFTDASVPYYYPQSAFVEAGMAPHYVFTAATISPTTLYIVGTSTVVRCNVRVRMFADPA